MIDEYEGRTATSKDGKARVVWRSGEWVNDDTYVPPFQKAKTSAQDAKDLSAALTSATVARDMGQKYAEVRQAVNDFDTGPTRANIIDALTPEDDGGLWDALGGTIGAFPRAVGLPSQQTMTARDQLRTTAAEATIAKSNAMKGAPSDKDAALARLTGVSPYKSVVENNRVIDKAAEDTGREQARTRVRANWITKYGSQSAAAPNGMTIADALAISDRVYAEDFHRRRRETPGSRGQALGSRMGSAIKSKLGPAPKAMPGKTGPILIDINGNRIR